MIAKRFKVKRFILFTYGNWNCLIAGISTGLVSEFNFFY